MVGRWRGPILAAPLTAQVPEHWVIEPSGTASCGRSRSVGQLPELHQRLDRFRPVGHGQVIEDGGRGDGSVERRIHTRLREP
jgi:hypothetical protein